jgi:hypothetical protein
MEPVTIVILSIALGGAIIGAAAAAFYWTKILQWGMENLQRWVEQHLPGMGKYVRNAFAYVDVIGSPAHAIAKEAWRELRRALLRQIQLFEQQADGTWLLRVTSWLRTTLEELETTESEVAEVITERKVAVEDLPPEVRREWLRQERTAHEFILTEFRDKELGLELSV